MQCSRARAGVDLEIADLDSAGRRARRSSQQRADASVDLLRREGLDDVVVGAGVEQPDDLELVVTRRPDDQRDGADGAEHLQEIAAVDVGETEIEHHHVGTLVDHRLERRQPVRRLQHHVAARDQGTDQWVHEHGRRPRR